MFSFYPRRLADGHFRADTVLKDLKSLSDLSTSLYNSVSSAKKAAFFQLVQHPVQATYTLANMWISAGINNLRASQARLSTNNYADQVEALFAQDYDLEHEYHTLLDGTPVAKYHLYSDLTLEFRQMGSYDGPDPRYVLLLAATHG